MKFVDDDDDDDDECIKHDFMSFFATFCKNI